MQVEVCLSSRNGWMYNVSLLPVGRIVPDENQRLESTKVPVSGRQSINRTREPQQPDRQMIIACVIIVLNKHDD